MDDLLITERDKALFAMQRVELEGLQEIDRICRKHGIKYSLGGGTCLGQYRHGGFIPWDDDIDVDMTVENYEHFMDVALDELDKTRFFLRCRKTDHTHLRSAARLEIIGTHISIPRWDGQGKDTGVFVDIFRWNYLPDDPVKRRRVASELFFIHCMQSYKEYHRFAAMLDPGKRFRLRTMSSLISEKALEKREEKLIHICKGKTGWIIDDAIIHGDHGGYPSEGIDEYEDVEFEGLTVMNKKNSENFLRTIYGDHFNEWLPPAKRISHHTWTTFDLGKYADKYDLDPSYKDAMTIKYSYIKLKQMKIVSDQIVDAVREICDENSIHYNIAVLSEKAVKNSFPEIRDLWTSPVKILMMRKDYDRFAGICSSMHEKKFFYQAHDTEEGFYYGYSRFRLNLTSIRVRKLKPGIEKEMNDGFFVNIIPLDNCPDEDNIAFINKVRELGRELKAKWATRNFNTFFNLSSENKKRFLKNRKYTLEQVYQKYISTVTEYKDVETKLCFDSSMKLGGKVFKKEKLMNSVYLPILSKESYGAKNVDEFADEIWHRYGACYLNYYDVPEYQLSILRYDEKTGKMLSNDEILDMEYEEH